MYYVARQKVSQPIFGVLLEPAPNTSQESIGYKGQFRESLIKRMPSYSGSWAKEQVYQFYAAIDFSLRVGVRIASAYTFR